MWIGVDLDGTLAQQIDSVDSIGPPVPRMLRFVQDLLAAGEDVRIFTARAWPPDSIGSTKRIAQVQSWCQIHLGFRLPVTCIKDPDMRVLYDDRAVAVEPNTGRRLGYAKGY